MVECDEGCIKGTSERSTIVFELRIGKEKNKIINIWKWFKGFFRRVIAEIYLVTN